MTKLNWIKFVIHSYVNATTVKTATATATAKTSQQTAKKEGPDPKKKPPKAGHKPGGYKLYKYLTAFVCVPLVAVIGLNTYMEHVEEQNLPRQDYIPYEYLCLRNKRYPWGDGTRTLFHNPKKNALKDGYEE